MQLIIGFALCLVFFLCLGLSFYIGYRLGTKKTKSPMQKLTEEEEYKQKLREEGFKNVMNYDMEQAMGLRGVRK